MGKSIAFLMPGDCPRSPMGGFKVVFLYANYLASAGYDVSILYPLVKTPPHPRAGVFYEAGPRFLRWKLQGMSARKWFDLDPRVKERVVYSLDFRHVGRYDAYVATQVFTPFPLAKYPEGDCKKLYLIQDYEGWQSSDEIVRDSYRLGLENIVIADWLKEVVEEAGGCATVIKNGFDFDYFQKSKSIEGRDPKSIAMLYHLDERKGVKYGLEALKILKERYPDLKVTLFGTPHRPADLPGWMEYVQTPDQKRHNEIYNEAAIYLATSVQEGWGLTVGEAMICGAAVVCSEAKGFQEMVTDGETGLIARTADVSDIVDKVTRLIEDSAYRIKISKRGHENIKNFSWEKSFEKFEKLLNA